MLKRILFGTVLSSLYLSSMVSVSQAQCVTVDPVLVSQLRVNPFDAAGASELVQPFILTFRRAAVGSDPFTVRFQIVDEDAASVSRVGEAIGPIVSWTGASTSRDIGAMRHESYALLRTGIVTFNRDEMTSNSQIVMRLSDLRSDLPAGVYREQYSVRFWCEADGEALAYEAPGSIAVSAAVPNVLSANIAGASLRGEIDFMNFEMLSRSLNLSVRSTGPFKVTARSENEGVLLRDGSVMNAKDAEKISYQAYLAGNRIELDGVTAQFMDRAGLLGRQFPLEIRVASVGSKRAGTYSDILYVVLSPAN